MEQDLQLRSFRAVLNDELYMCHTDQVVEGNDIGFFLLAESDKTFVQLYIHSTTYDMIIMIFHPLPELSYSTYLFLDFHSMTKLKEHSRKICYRIQHQKVFTPLVVHNLDSRLLI